MKAVIYARQSSGNEEVSESVEAQIKNCLEIAEREGFEVIGIFRDLNCSGELYPVGAEDIARLDDAYQSWKQEQSGKKKYRTGLGDLIQKLPEADILLVNEMTRLYRPVNNSFLEDFIHNQLKKYHVAVLQVQGGKIDLSQFDQQLILALKNQILYDDLQKKRENSIKAFRNKRDSGKLCCGSRIFAINYLGKDRICVDPNRKQIVRLIYDRILAGMPLNSIIRECNESAGGLIMYPSLLYSIAHQPLYAGYQYNTKGDLIRNIQITGQEFIELEEWQKVQELLSRRGKGSCGRNGNYWLPLSGRIYCGVCGRKLVCRIDHGKIYYICNSHKFDPRAKDCSRSRIRFDSGVYGKYSLYETVIPLLCIGVLESWRKLFQVRDPVVISAEYFERQQIEILDLFMDGYLTKKEVKQFVADRKESYSAGEQDPYSIFQKWEHAVLVRKLRRIAAGDIEKKLYEDLLEQSGIQLTVRKDSVLIQTLYGEIEVERVRARKQCWMPKWHLRFSWKRKGELYPLPDIKITYFSGEKKVLGSFFHLEIVSDKEKKPVF